MKKKKMVTQSLAYNVEKSRAKVEREWNEWTKSLKELIRKLKSLIVSSRRRIESEKASRGWIVNGKGVNGVDDRAESLWGNDLHAIYIYEPITMNDTWCSLDYYTVESFVIYHFDIPSLPGLQLSVMYTDYMQIITYRYVRSYIDNTHNSQ